ncbi:hypothetical protein N9U75_00360 [Pelagibacteraceae bacterium]|nr:hypothetical protein [Pelagibacteraceae bacterium]
MNQNKISIAKKTLQLLETQSWNSITLDQVLNNQKKIIFKNKIDLLTNLNRYFDFILTQKLSSLEKSSTKDMLFEVLMARLDILNNYRVSIKKLLKLIISKPKLAIKLLPSFIESIILIATHSEIKINGVNGILKLKLIFILYILIIYTWNKDETESLEKTMTVLDKYINNIDKFIKLN